jgi:NTP pyrophosphatase (non-canonical NTP hydrolase)
MADLTLRGAQKEVDDWINTIGVRYFDELTCFAVLSEEVGEVARIVARKYGEQSSKKTDEGQDLGDELADVLFAMICLANKTGIDLEAEFAKNMAKKNGRDKERHINNEKLK